MISFSLHAYEWRQRLLSTEFVQLARGRGHWAHSSHNHLQIIFSEIMVTRTLCCPGRGSRPIGLA